MDDKVLLIIFLALQFIFQVVTKNSNSEVIKKIDEVMKQYGALTHQLTKDITEQIKDKRNGYTEPVKRLLDDTQELKINGKKQEENLRSITSALLENTLAHHSTIAAIQRLTDHLDNHAEIFKDQADRFSTDLSLHTQECRKYNMDRIKLGS